MDHQTWFHTWLSEFGLRDMDGVKSAADNPKAIKRLGELAEKNEFDPPAQTSSQGASVLAGRTLDLTGHMACSNASCRAKQVDKLFNRIWHYFDQIQVVGPDSHDLLDLISDPKADDYLADFITGNARILFHIEEIGVGPLLKFGPKPPPCPVHWEGYKDHPEIQINESIVDSLAGELLKHGHVVERMVRDHPVTSFVHPLLADGEDRRFTKRVPPPEFEGQPVAERLARSIVREYWMGAVTDLYAMQQSSLPLGSGVPLELEILRSLSPDPTPASVAFNLDLPVVEGMPPKELMAFRRDEGIHFEAFRIAIRRAINERLANDPHGESQAIAKEISDDVIRPALNDIERSLSTAREILTRKYELAVALGGLATVCGALGALPLALPVAAGAVAAAGAAKSKEIEETSALSQNDMYFLWKVHNHNQ